MIMMSDKNITGQVMVIGPSYYVFFLNFTYLQKRWQLSSGRLTECFVAFEMKQKTKKFVPGPF